MSKSNILTQDGEERKKKFFKILMVKNNLLIPIIFLKLFYDNSLYYLFRKINCLKKK